MPSLGEVYDSGSSFHPVVLDDDSISNRIIERLVIHSRSDVRRRFSQTSTNYILTSYKLLGKRIVSSLRRQLHTLLRVGRCWEYFKEDDLPSSWKDIHGDSACEVLDVKPSSASSKRMVIMLWQG